MRRNGLPPTRSTLAMSIPTPFWFEITYSPGARGLSSLDGPSGIVCERTVWIPPMPAIG